MGVRCFLSLAALLTTTACAVVQDPPGGPPDFDAPVLVSVSPDSGAIVPDLHDPLVFRFDEVISERSGGTLDKLIELSPRAEQVNVHWKRNAVEVRPARGWKSGIVYQVRLLPGMTDLRSNRMTDGKTVVFTTGGDIPDTRLEGVVLDWEGGRVGRNALIEATLLPDSLTYTGTADSAGEFVMTALPTGTYLVDAVIDGNNNRRREPREPFDSITVGLDSNFTYDFWTFAHDTLGPQIRQVVYVDSTAARVQFTQYLLPGEPDSTAVSLFVLPDTTPVAVSSVLTAARFDSVRAAEREAADSARADSARADSARAGGAEGAAGADTVAAPPQAPRAPPRRGARAPADTAQAADSTRAERLLATRPRLQDAWVLRPAQPFVPGGRYLVATRATNPNGVVGASQVLLIIPAPNDST